jgi:hypothetical protein
LRFRNLSFIINTVSSQKELISIKGILRGGLMRKQHFGEIDGQGLTREQAFTAIDARLRRANGAYRLCAIYAMKN